MDAGHQAIVEQRVCFSHIDDIDLDLFVFGRVRQPEVKPLRISLCIYVILQDQVVLVLVHFVDTE